VLPPPALVSDATVAGRDQVEVGNNPVLWRELRRPLVAGTRGRLAGILIILLLIISYGCFASVRALHEQELQLIYAVILNGLYWLLVAVLSATAIAQEKESDTWTLLLTAPLSAARIIQAKLLGIAGRMLWPTLLIVAHFTLFLITSVINPAQWFIILWVIITFNVVWAATGLYLSLRVKKVTTAVIANLMIPLVLYLAVPAGMLAIGELIARNAGEDAAEVTGTYIPYVYLAGAESRRWNLAEPYWFPVAGNISESTYVLFSVGMGLLYLLIAAVIVRRTVDRFDSLVGRAKQLVPIT
jgi:ABC-type transport system involved in multi-copper enzyme maturation permease subunit